MRLAVGTFAAMLQLTLVWDHRPWRRLGPVTGGLAALTTAWAVALAMYAAGGPTTLLQLIAAWQVWFFVLWKGWPFAGRAPLGTAVVLAGSVLSYASTLWVSAPLGPRTRKVKRRFAQVLATAVTRSARKFATCSATTNCSAKYSAA